VDAEEIEALVDVDHAGFVRGQPQSQWCEHGRHLLTQCLGMAPFPGHHHDKIVREADNPPVPETVLLASSPFAFRSHLLPPLTVEMIIQGGQGDVGEQR
jgi:hypothetical protein